MFSYMGFWIKVAQVIGKPDLAPAAWVRRLVTLCDQAPTTPSRVVQLVMEKELGQSVDELFERFELDPLGSASIAQVLEVFDLLKLSLLIQCHCTVHTI